MVWAFFYNVEREIQVRLGCLLWSIIFLNQDCNCWSIWSISRSSAVTFRLEAKLLPSGQVTWISRIVPSWMAFWDTAFIKFGNFG